MRCRPWSLPEVNKCRMRCIALGSQMVILIPWYSPQIAKGGTTSTSREGRREITEKGPMPSQEGKWVHSKGWEETSGQKKRARIFQKQIHESCTVRKKNVIYRGLWCGWDSRKSYSACICKHVFLWETGKKTLCITSQEERKGRKEKIQHCQPLDRSLQETLQSPYRVTQSLANSNWPSLLNPPLAPVFILPLNLQLLFSLGLVNRFNLLHQL